MQLQKLALQIYTGNDKKLDQTIQINLDLIIRRHCRAFIPRISSLCVSVLKGRRLFSLVSIEACAPHLSQGDFSAVGRQSNESNPLDSPSLLHSHPHNL